MGYWIDLINLVGIYIILAMSLNVICGMTGLLHLGHAGFYAIGAYTAALLSLYALDPAWGHANFLLTGGAAMAAAAVFAVLIGGPCLRLRGDYLAIATLGFGEIVRLTLTNIEFTKTAAMKTAEAAQYGEGFTLDMVEPRFGGATGVEMMQVTDLVHSTSINPYPPQSALGGFFARLQHNPFTDGAGFDNRLLGNLYEIVCNCWFIWIFVVITTVLLLNLKRSAIGRAMLAIREDEIAARAMGVNASAYKILAFVLSAAFAGLAGALFAHMTTSLTPGSFGLLVTIHVLLMVVLGGLGSFTGAGFAAVILVVLPALLSFLPKLGGEKGFDLGANRQLVFAILLILLIRWVPNGLLGLREGRDVWSSLRAFIHRRRARRVPTGGVIDEP